jgi:hypothetical protein
MMFSSRAGIPKPIGWKKASTFTGFCARHDSDTFASLETVAFSGTEKQCFLIGYRAVCHELHKKSGSVRELDKLKENCDCGRPVHDQYYRQAIVQKAQDWEERGRNDFEALKSIMDHHLLREDYSAWSRVVVYFEGPLWVASTGAVTVEGDLEGNQGQILHDKNTRPESLLCGVVSRPDGGAVVLTWMRNERSPRKFVDFLLNNGGQRLPGYLVQFMFAYIENTCFSRAWWESLNDVDRNYVGSLARNVWPNHKVLNPVFSQIVPWRVTDITDSDRIK